MLVEFFALVALGQDTTTVCRPLGSQVICETTQRQTGMDAYNAARTAASARQAPVASSPGSCAGGDWLLAGCTYGAHRAAREAREAEASQREAETAQTNLRYAVAALLERGMCAEAISAALQGGDVDLATQARSFCAAPTPSQP